MNDTLITKYRPTQFDEVAGQDAAVRSLERAITNKTARQFLLVGPSGTGKTTLARIAAVEMAGSLDALDCIEFDAASKTGVEDIRALTDMLKYRPTGAKTFRAFIVDESHRLSGSAWDALLKVIEEPPAWAAWFLCTTNPSKVPETIKTRCHKIELQPVSENLLYDLLEMVSKEEQMKPAKGVLQLCARQAQGSPRAAIAFLGAVAGAESKEEALSLLKSAEEKEEAVALARLLVSGGDWPAVQELLGKLKADNPESIRHVVRAYVTSVLLNSKKEPSGNLFAILDAFGTVFNSSDGISPVVLACGKMMLGS